MSAHVRLYPDNDGKWRWRARAGNNRIVAASPKGYPDQAECLARCQAAMRVLATATQAGFDSDQSGVKFFHEPSGWYWHATDADDELVAKGGEGYTHRTDCVDGAKLAMRVLTGAELQGLES